MSDDRLTIAIKALEDIAIIWYTGNAAKVESDDMYHIASQALIVLRPELRSTNVARALSAERDAPQADTSHG